MLGHHCILLSETFADGQRLPEDASAAKRPTARARFVAATRLKSGIVALHYRRRTSGYLSVHL